MANVTTSAMHLQSVYHGFGQVVPIGMVMNKDKLHLRDAIIAVIEDPTFQASISGPFAVESLVRHLF